MHHRCGFSEGIFVMMRVGTSSTAVVSSWLARIKWQFVHIAWGIFEEAVGSLCIETLQDVNRTCPTHKDLPWMFVLQHGLRTIVELTRRIWRTNGWEDGGNMYLIANQSCLRERWTRHTLNSHLAVRHLCFPSCLQKCETSLKESEQHT